MKKKLVIVGGGGLGREVAALLRALPEFEILGFYDDAIPAGTRVSGYPVLGSLQTLATTHEPVNAVVAVGNPQIKQRIVSALVNDKIRYPVIIHPTVVLGDLATIKLGAGTILTAGVKLTVDIELGAHVLVNLNSTIGHNALVGDCCSIMPGVNLAGEVTLGKRVLLGSGSNVINRVSIGDDAKIGSGSVVITDIAEKSTAVGVPARIIK